MKVAKTVLKKVRSNEAVSSDDLLAVEEPLEIRLTYLKNGLPKEEQLSVIMRTPGHDLELGLGFLFSEGIISHADDVKSISHCQQVKSPEEQGNVVKVALADDLLFDSEKHHRYFFANSSCGVCGKSSIESLKFKVQKYNAFDSFTLDTEVLKSLPQQMHSKQLVFGYTGGIHAAALFNAEGDLLYLREDIGRHNALDKIIGAACADQLLPLHRQLLLVSGRVGFELIQKALMAGIQVAAAIGAPSDLAVKMAESYGMTLIGFLKENSFNIYSGEKRIKMPSVLKQPENG